MFIYSGKNVSPNQWKYVKQFAVVDTPKSVWTVCFMALKLLWVQNLNVITKQLYMLWLFLFFNFQMIRAKAAESNHQGFSTQFSSDYIRLLSQACNLLTKADKVEYTWIKERNVQVFIFS